MNQLLTNTCLCLALLSLAGCGTSSYGDAVKKSQPELERRGKFAVLGPGYKKLTTFPIAFRVPKVFLEDDTVNQRWTSTNGEAVKLTSKDPIELKNNPDFRGTIRPELAIPLEMQDALLNQGHQGTYFCEYKVINLRDPNDPGSATESKQVLMMSIWVFDTSAQSKIKPPNDVSVLSGAKVRGKSPAKAVSWEEDVIDCIPTPENPNPGTITAKLARLPVISKFMVGQDMNRIPMEKKGLLRLWSFRLENNRYQVFLALRIPMDLAEGDTPEFPIDAENPNSDKLLDIGRAVIGTMAVVPDAAPEAEAKK